MGIAAGDEFQLLNEDGEFEVIRRSGNVAVQVYSRNPVEPVVQAINRLVAAIGGVLDGKIKRAVVFTVPAKAGFPVIEETFNSIVKEHPEMEWFYSNVYDPANGVTPLNWWVNGD